MVTLKLLGNEKWDNVEKKSGNELSTLKITSITAIRRPNPPTDLTKAQSDVWHHVVDRMPAEWFPRETHDLLVAYCRSVVSANVIAQLIDDCLYGETSDNWLDSYDKLLRMQEREGRQIGNLATKMRLTQQSRFSHRKGTGPKGPKPWEAAGS